MVPKWLSRAKAFADDLIANEQSSQHILQQVHESALSTLCAVPNAPAAAQWIDATRHLGLKLIPLAEPQQRPLLEWQLGVALADAVAIQQTQGAPDEALRLGEVAAKLMKGGLSASEQIPEHDYLIGRLYYRMGAITAMNRKDHKGAIKWYEKSVPLLQSPVPNSALIDPARQGDMFVSMAVSYWEGGGRKEASRLTKEGVRLIEVAVEDGLALRKTLAVPYNNLSTMFGDMGDTAKARHYSELATRVEKAKK